MSKIISKTIYDLKGIQSDCCLPELRKYLQIEIQSASSLRMQPADKRLSTSFQTIATTYPYDLNILTLVHDSPMCQKAVVTSLLDINDFIFSKFHDLL